MHQKIEKNHHSLSNIEQSSIKLPIPLKDKKETNYEGSAIADNQSFPAHSSRISQPGQQLHADSGFYSGKDAERNSKMYRKLSEK